MTTKRDGLFLKQQQQLSVSSHSHSSDERPQFSNLNLNQSLKCTNVQTFSKSCNDKNYGYTVTENYQENRIKVTKDFSFKTSKNSNLIVKADQDKESEKRWKKDKNSSSLNSSTLSLHIAAYENSVEVDSNEIQDLPKKSTKRIFDSLTKFQAPQNHFEFPRQMEGNSQGQGGGAPEVQKFTASQKLLAPNQGTPSSNSNFAYAALLKKHLTFSDDKIEYDPQEVLRIIKDSKALLAAEPTLLEIQLPCIVVGDIHGQYLDLHRIFGMLGQGNKAGQVSRRYLFLGDYVDRGPNSLECIITLLLNKLAYPKMFNLLRGNHESIAINRVYGFWQELRDRFNDDDGNIIWRAFNDLFAYLPLAAIIHGRILCMHGGIGPTLNSLDDIRNIKRPLEDPNSNQLACDLLWADPMIDLKGYVQNTVRGVSVYFGEDAVVSLCEKLKIDLIVRAHQMMLNGYGFYCKRRLLTIFSAPRYYPEKNNKGAVLKIDKNLKIGFFLLNPVTQNTRGESKFRNDYAQKNDDSSYMSRQGSSDSSSNAGPPPPPAAGGGSGTSNSTEQNSNSGFNPVSPDSGAFLQKK